MDEMFALAAEASNKQGVGEIIVLFDCCHSGYAGELWAAPGVNLIPQNTCVLTASAADQAAFE